MSGLSQNLSKQKQKEQQTIQSEKQKQTEIKTDLPAPESGEKVKVIGRDTLGDALPREAVEKDLTGAVKGFFGLNKSRKPIVVGDENVIVPQPRVEAGPELIPAVDLTDEERIHKSVKARKSAWGDYTPKIQEIIDSEEFKSVSDETRRIFDEIMTVSLEDMTNRDKAKIVVSVSKKLAGLESGQKKVKDLQIRLRLNKILKQMTDGTLDLPAADRIQDFSDDSYFKKTTELPPPAPGSKVKLKYDKGVIDFDDREEVTSLPLFQAEPCMTDVTQGDIGDCYFLTAINTILDHDPSLIKKCMKDEGKTVVVRFFDMHTGEPVYIRVSKTVPVKYSKGTDFAGNEVRSKKTRYGSKGPLWVLMMEKAFAAARFQVDPWFRNLHKSAPPKGYDSLSGGQTYNAIQILAGTRMDVKHLPGGKHEGKYKDIGTLFTHVHYGEKEEFMKVRNADGTKRTAADWNKYKAEKIFGIKIKPGQDNILDMFRKNRAFDVYQTYLRNQLNSRFQSVPNSGVLFSSSNPAFRTMNDLDFFLDSIKITEMPTLNLGHGIDEMAVRRHYLKYFRDSIATSGILGRGVNVNDEYSEEEKKVYEDIESNTKGRDGYKRMITASTSQLDLTFKKGEQTTYGSAGEHIVTGIAGTHGYSILGTETRDVTVGGKKISRRFVVVHNPWNNYCVRLYERDTLRPFTASENKEAKGTFLMELSDFCNTFASYEVEKTGESLSEKKSRVVPEAPALPAPMREAAIDLTREERISASEKKREKSWADLAAVVKEIIDLDVYKNASDETKLYFDRIMDALKPGVTEEVRVATETEVYKRLYEISERIKGIDMIDGPDEEAVNAEKQRKLAEIPDYWILMRLFTLLDAKTGGGLEVPKKAKIQTVSDDLFPEREFKLKRKRTSKDGQRYDRINIKIEKKKESDKSDEPLFATEPAISDIKQGYLGDCYFLSALNALMFKDPQLIKNCMRDEGSTVLVRFYNMTTGAPVYVRVRKTVPTQRYKGKDWQGDNIASEEELYGNKGPLWVTMMEKAFAAVREQLDIYCKTDEYKNFSKDRRGHGTLDLGSASHAIKMLTGMEMEAKLLPGGPGRKTYKDISVLFNHVHYSEKEAFLRGKNADGTKRKASDWNRYKAEKIFGVKIGEGNNRLLDIFRKNRVFDAYQRFMKDHLERNFNSVGNKDAKPAFSTLTDLDLFIDSIDISQMPTLNLGHGIDEDQVKRHYIEYFRSTIAASGILKCGGNTTGKYSEAEKAIFKDITNNLTSKNGKKRAVTASTSRHGLSIKADSAMLGGGVECLVGGVADIHVYTILGTETREVDVNGKTVKMNFVVINNPWNNHMVRLYEKDTMKPYMPSEGTEAKGTFLMELSDFCNTFQEYNVEKDGAYKPSHITHLVEDDEPEHEAAVDMTDAERETASVREMKYWNSEIRRMLDEIRNSPDYPGYAQETKDIIDRYHHMVADDTKVKARNTDGSRILPVLKEVWTAKQSRFGAKDTEVLMRLAAILIRTSSGDLELTGAEKIEDHTSADKDNFESIRQMNEPYTVGDEQVTITKKEIITDDPICDRSAHPLFATEPSADDLVQGDLGDCFMITGLKAIVEKDPSIIKEAMKDEGGTVVVRFHDHKSLQPVYVRVKKSLAITRTTYIDSKGNTITAEKRKGAQGALWVNILEKAFSYARPHLHDPRYTNSRSRGLDVIGDGGLPADFVRIFIGRKFKETKLKGDTYDSRDYYDFDNLAYSVKDSLKTDFMSNRNEDGSKRTAKDWNIYKAKYIFGIDIPSGDTKLYDMFRKNTIIDGYNEFIKEYLISNFVSKGRVSTLEPGFATTLDLDMFLDSIDLNQMPDFGLESGIDEMELKKRYIEYLRTSIKKLNVLSGNVNLDEKYKDKEDAIYEQLKNATAPTTGKRKTVIGSIRGMTLQKIKKDAKDTGNNGEAKILGIAGTHSYVINGVTTRTVTIGGRPLERKFVEIHNPWHNNYIRLYDKDTLKPFVRKSDRKNDGTYYDNKGMFLMELRDFIETFQGFNIEE